MEVHYIYAEPTGVTRDSVGIVKVPVGSNVMDMLSKILEVDPPLEALSTSFPLTYRYFRLYESKDALDQEAALNPSAVLVSGVDNASQPILVVPRIPRETQVEFLREDRKDKIKKYVPLGEQPCTLYCNRFDILQLNELARMCHQGLIRGFLLKHKSGAKVRLLEIAGGLYGAMINSSYCLDDGERSCVQVIIADDMYYDKKVQLSSNEIATCFPFTVDDSPLIIGGADLLNVSKASPPPQFDDIDIDAAISAAELVIFCMMKFQGLAKEQFSRSLASTVQYIALLVVMLDARKTAAGTGGNVLQTGVGAGAREEEGVTGDSGNVLQTGVGAGAREEEGVTGDSANASGSGPGEWRGREDPDLTASEEESKATGDSGGGGKGVRRSARNKNTSSSGSTDGPANRQMKGRRSAESADSGTADEAEGAAASTSARGSSTRTRSLTSREGKSSAASAGVSNRASADPKKLPSLVDDATARYLVMAEEMPVPLNCNIDIRGRFIHLNGFLDYFVAHAETKASMGRSLSEGGLVVTEVKPACEYEAAKAFSQAIAGAQTILRHRKAEGLGQGGSGGPMHIMKTDGIRWHCGRLVERFGMCPKVNLDEEVSLEIHESGWPTNTRVVLNYVARVFRECLKSSPRVTDASVLGVGRLSSALY